MAAPLALQKKPVKPEEEIEQRLEKARLDHAEALLAAYQLLQEAKDGGVLDLLRGAVGSGGDLITRLAEAMNTPDSIRTVRNLLSLGRILASVDPDLLHRLANELSTPKPGMISDSKPPGLFRTLLRFGSPEGRRVLSASVAFVEAFGRALAKGKA